MCGSMADIQSPTAEIMRGKKRKKRKRKKKPKGKNIMVCPISYGDHNYGINIISEEKYYGRNHKCNIVLSRKV